jgi:hypothetical protein
MVMTEILCYNNFSSRAFPIARKQIIIKGKLFDDMIYVS